MSHNRTHRALLSEVLAMPPSAYPAHRLILDCAPDCIQGRAYLVRDIAGVFRPATMGELVRRLRCAECGRAPTRVVMAWRDGRGWSEIALRGDRSD